MNTDPATFLMANLGSEVTRLFRAIGEKNKERMQGAYGRACQILDDIQALPEAKEAEREFSLLRDVLTDSVREVPQLRVRFESLRQYFMPFALRALSERHIF